MHGEYYDYSECVYVNSKTLVKIGCPKHGPFYQRPTNHLQGIRCPHCGGEIGGRKIASNTAEFIEKALAIHGEKYDFSEVEYVAAIKKVTVRCKEHGYFQMTPQNLLAGHGCPRCNSSILERKVSQILRQNAISFNEQQTFDWLTDAGHLYLDLFIPDYGVAIECQGIQHFTPLEIWGGEQSFQETQRRDELKHTLCKEHGIEILYFSNLKIDYPYFVIEDPGHLIEAIKLNGKVDPSKWKAPELPLSF